MTFGQSAASISRRSTDYVGNRADVAFCFGLNALLAQSPTKGPAPSPCKCRGLTLDSDMLAELFFWLLNIAMVAYALTLLFLIVGGYDP